MTTRSQRNIASKFCYCKLDKNEEFIICQTSDKANCPGQGKYHKSCLSQVEINEDFVCEICNELQSPSNAQSPSFGQPSTQSSPPYNFEEYTHDDDSPIEMLPPYTKEVEKVLTHHYISRKYKDGSEIVKKLHFKLKWSGYRITEYVPVETIHRVEATEAMRVYFDSLSKRATSTLIKRHPDLVSFLRDDWNLFE